MSGQRAGTFGSCRWCGKRVVWVPNDRTGKLAPIDVSLADDGPIVLADGGTYHVLTRAERAAGDDRPRHTNHWQTCAERDRVKEAYGR